jgi:hypothetical protein
LPVTHNDPAPAEMQWIGTVCDGEYARKLTRLSNREGHTSSIPTMRNDAEPLLANTFEGHDLFAIQLADS